MIENVLLSFAAIAVVEQPSNSTAVFGLLGVIGSAIIVGFFGWLHLRTRKPADARDDKTAEVATAKSAAEVAMELVDTTKSWALEIIGLLRSENARLSTRNEDLEAELTHVRAEILALRLAGGQHADEIAAAKVRETILQGELTEAKAQLARLQAALDDAESRGLEELTLTPQAVTAHRDRMKKEEGTDA